VSATLEFNRGAVRPFECIREGWNLIKGEYWLFLGISVVAMLVGGAVPLGILLGPMMCGVYIALFRRQRGEPVTFDLLFKGFDFFADSLIATLIQVVPILIVLVPTYLGTFVYFFSTIKPGRRGAPPDLYPFFVMFCIIFVVIMILSIIVGAFFIFTFPLIVDRKLSGMNAVKTSFNAAVANFGGVLGLLLSLMVLGFVGLLFCYVGAFLLLPLHFAAYSIAYRKVFGTGGLSPYSAAAESRAA
jgi:hypothetical protein